MSAHLHKSPSNKEGAVPPSESFGGGIICKAMNEIKTDVIAQWNADGTIIPLRIRVHTEDDAETYTIQGYREIEHETTEVHGVFVTAGTHVWECSITVNGARKHIWLYFDGRWGMRY